MADNSLFALNVSKIMDGSNGDGIALVEFDTLPQATYLAQAETVEVKQTRRGSGYNLVVLYRIVGGEYAGRHIRQFVYLTGFNKVMLDNTLLALGYDPADLTALADHVSELVGHFALIKVIQRVQDEGSVKAEVVDVYNVDTMIDRLRERVMAKLTELNVDEAIQARQYGAPVTELNAQQLAGYMRHLDKAGTTEVNTPSSNVPNVDELSF